MFLQGSQALVSGEDNAIVLFARAFSATPQAIFAWVENLHDDPVLEIDAQVADKTADGFSVALNMIPDSSNYTLQWFAGDASALYQALSPGRATSEHPLFLGDLADNDFVLITLLAPALRTVRVRVSSLKALFPNLAAAPASTASPGVAGQIAIDANYIYSHDGTLWGRSARNTTW
jgi:hypothetical protein